MLVLVEVDDRVATVTLKPAGGAQCHIG